MNKVESALSRTTDTKALVIGTDTLPQVADMFRKLFPDKRALVVADANTWRVAGDDVHKILAGAGVAQDEPYVFTDPKLYAEWAYVGELDTVLAETDAVPVAVGSGVINDLTKLCSGAESSGKSLAMRFEGIIKRACRQEGQRVVILVEEYDKPMLQAIGDDALQKSFRNTLEAFYGALKS